MELPSDEVRSVLCPACLSKPGFPCTQPTSESRVAVRWVHYARVAKAVQVFNDCSEQESMNAAAERE